MSKTFFLNILNLNTEADAERIKNHFSNMTGVEKVEIEMSINLVSVRYTEDIGSPNKILIALGELGYPVR